MRFLEMYADGHYTNNAKTFIYCTSYAAILDDIWCAERKI